MIHGLCKTLSGLPEHLKTAGLIASLRLTVPFARFWAPSAVGPMVVEVLAQAQSSRSGAFGHKGLMHGVNITVVAVDLLNVGLRNIAGRGHHASPRAPLLPRWRAVDALQW